MVDGGAVYFVVIVAPLMVIIGPLVPMVIVAPLRKGLDAAGCVPHVAWP